MKFHSEIEGWLVRWASQHGGRVNAEPSGVYTFEANDIPMQLTLYEEGDSLLVAALLLDEDIQSFPAAAFALLKHAHLGERTHQCAVSLAESGRPVLWHWVPTQSLDAIYVENCLANVIAAAKETRDLLRDAMHRTERAPARSQQPQMLPHEALSALRG